MISLNRLSICYARTGARTHFTKAHIESIKGVDQLMSNNNFGILFREQMLLKHCLIVSKHQTSRV